MKRKLFLPCIATLVLFASCKKTIPKQVIYIPKDALIVAGIYPKSVKEKTGGANIDWDSLASSFITSNSESVMKNEKNDWQDFQNSGVDTDAAIFFFSKSAGSIQKGSTNSFAVIASLQDAAKFEAYLKKKKPEKEVKKSGNYSYMALGDDAVAGWNKDAVIISVVTGGNAAPGTYSSGEGTLSQLQLTALFNQKESESIASIGEFRDLMAKKSDMIYWTNSSASLSSLAFLGITKFGDLLRDSYTAGTVNFENGKVVAESETYVNKTLSDMLKKYPGPDADVNMIEQYPYPVNGFLSLSFNPQLLIEIIKYSGFDMLSGQYMKEMGFTLDDVAKAFKGDFAIVFSDFRVTTSNEESIGSGVMIKTKPAIKVLFNAKVGDKAAYDKIVASLAAKGFIVKQGDQYVPAKMGMKDFAMEVNDKNILVASNDSLLQQYKSGKGNAAIPADIKDKLKGKKIIFYADINAMLQSIQVDTANERSLNIAKAVFKDVIAASNGYNGKQVKSEIEFRTMNDKENSLVSLMNFFSIMAKENKPRMNMNRMKYEGINPDSLRMKLPDSLQ